MLIIPLREVVVWVVSQDAFGMIKLDQLAVDSLVWKWKYSAGCKYSVCFVKNNCQDQNMQGQYESKIADGEFQSTWK
jgi:hypothetical protein